MPGDSIPKAADNDGAWGFTKQDAARVSRTVKRVEAQFYNRSPDRGRYPVAGGGSTLLPLSIQSNVTAGSESAPSTFTAIIQVPSGTSHGWTTTGGTSVTAYNRAAGIAFTASSGTPKSGWGTTLQGVVYLVAADC